MQFKRLPLALCLTAVLISAGCDGDETASDAPDAAPLPSTDASADSGPAAPCVGSTDPTCLDSAGVKLGHALYRTENMNGQLRIIISESPHLCTSTPVDPAAVSITIAVPATPGTYQVSMVSGAWESPPAGAAAVIYSTGEAHANANDDGSYAGTVTVSAVGAVVTGSLDATAATHGRASGTFSATLCEDLDFR